MHRMQKMQKFKMQNFQKDAKNALEKIIFF